MLAIIIIEGVARFGYYLISSKELPNLFFSQNSFGAKMLEPCENSLFQTHLSDIAATGHTRLLSSWDEARSYYVSSHGFPIQLFSASHFVHSNALKPEAQGT